MFALVGGIETFHDPKTGEYYDPKEGWRTRNTRKIIGGRIVLDGSMASHDISRAEAGILKHNGLHKMFPRLPSEIANNSSEIGKVAGVKDGVIENLWVAADWVQDKDGIFRLLEVNRRPSLTTLRDYCGDSERFDERMATHWLIRRTIASLGQDLIEKA